MKHLLKYILSILLTLQSFPSHGYDDSGDREVVHLGEFEPVIITAGDDREDGYEDGNCVGSGCDDRGGPAGYGDYDDFDWDFENGFSWDESGGFAERYDKLSRAEQNSSEQDRAWVLGQMDQGAVEALESIEDRVLEKHGIVESECDSLSCAFWAGMVPSFDKRTSFNASTNDFIVDDLLQSIPDKAEGYRIDSIAGLGGRFVDSSPYTSSHAKELTQIRERLNQSSSKGPQQWNAKVEALKTLRHSDNAFLGDNDQLGRELQDLAVVLTDIATDIIPFTSIPKDLYRALVGKDPINGKELFPLERTLAAGFASANTVTFGAVGAAIASVKTIGRLAKATAKEVAFAQNLAEILAKSPLKAEVMVQGTTSEITLIGRDMVNVNYVADVLAQQGVKVNTLKGFSEAAEAQWDDLLGRYGGWISDEVVIKTHKYIENKEWIKAALEKGHTIIDIGNPSNRGLSPFYEMEKNEIKMFLTKVQP